MNMMTRDTQGAPSFCNFDIHVISIDQIYMNADCEPVLKVKLSLELRDGNEKTPKVHSIPVEHIDDMHWKNLDMRCYYDPNVSEKKVERYLSYIVRQSLSSAPRRRVYHLSHAGMYLIEGKTVFCTGTKIIHNHSFDSNILFEIDPMCQKLDADEKLSEEEAAAEFFRLLTLSPNAARIISAYKLGFFLRSAYERIGKIPKGCIYLHGQSGMQKTTYSSFLVQTYDRNSGIKSPSRLNASIPAAVNMLLDNPNDVVVMDDLFPADSKRIRGQQEETLIEITRYIADGTVPARMRGKELSQESPKCGVIFTGEKLIGRGSDAARLLPVEMEKPDTKELRYFQERPLIVSTFYRNYITWFIYNYDEICDILERLREKYENIAPCVHDRLREMYFFLGSSYFLFLQYLVEKKILPETDARRLYLAFDELLVMLVEQQNERVMGNQSAKSEQEDFLQRIRILYKMKQMSIADDVETFDKELHDGVFHRNKLYLRGERVPVYFPGSTIEDIADSLEAQGALETGKKGRTKQISRLKGMRFYVVIL